LYFYEKDEIMTTVDLKQSLLDEISKIESHEFFEALKVFIDFKMEKKIYHVSEEQMIVIEEGLREFERNEGISDEEFTTEIEKWLSTK
jgi:hypothetical protein